MTIYDVLKKYYGYSSFRPGQESLIKGILNGNDCMGIMPTGGGKSICYQVPALLLEGITLVISPLISLMKDQVDGLTENAIDSTFINSTLSTREVTARIKALQNGAYKLCYVAPERLGTPEFLSLAKQLNISLVAVDEAHCISQWGHDFRPSYLDIPRFIKALPVRPTVAAFTATATVQVREEIQNLLQLKNPLFEMTGFDRPNLFYQVVKPQSKSKFVLQYLEKQSPEASGIIFCSTRKSVESLTQELKKRGFSVAAYHAGFNAEVRQEVQEGFMRDRIKIIVATNAFGMGIDKPDVRYVLHYNLPKNMEAYYQEAGRAGRDGDPSECVLMYSPADVVKQKMMIGSSYDQFDLNKEREDMLHANLQILVNYCHAQGCLRAEILNYFGEMGEENCASCGNCNSTSEQVDLTIDAQKILSCIYRTNNRYGAGTIIKILRGSKDKKLMELGLNTQSTYGIMADSSDGLIKEIIMHLIAQGYLHMLEGKYPVLELTNTSKLILKGEERFFMKQDIIEATLSIKGSKEKTSKGRSNKASRGSDSNDGLFDKLAALRKSIADEKGLPAYIVFNNATLEEMAEYKPRTKADMLDIKGVGDKKYETYGEIFLNEILKHVNLDTK